MSPKRSIIAAAGFLFIPLIVFLASTATGLSRDRWTDGTPYGLFFNDYDPNFYTGFVPRVQDEKRIKIHLARGNQLRVRMILPDETIDNFLLDQVAKHDLYKEVIDKGIITLTTNTSWEDYDKRFEAEGIRELAARKNSLSKAAWRRKNIEAIEKLTPERLYHIQKDFGEMVTKWAALLKGNPPPETLGARLDLINEFFPHRMFVYDLTPEQESAFDELDKLAHAGDLTAFRPKARVFFEDMTDGIYPLENGKIDYYEYTAIYAAGTYDTTTTYHGHQIPQITTQGIWYFQPRLHGNGMLGMVDYISAAGYYGLIPMFPYEYGGGESYNSIHNTGISNWIAGHPLLPKEWRKYDKGSRNGKPYNRVALTSRGPVSHGCTRLNSGHLAELRELTPSTSDGLQGIVNYRNVSHCYDVFDRKGDGEVEIMGVQYYFAFRSTKSRVAKQIWAQNNRKDFYDWLYGNEMNYGDIGEVTFDEVCEGKFHKRKAVEGRTWKNLRLYEAPYEPETLQFYQINGIDRLSPEGMEFNREMRRVGHGYEVDRKILRLE
ncbi:MAG: hypothetical protein QF890_13790 [Myxococcota bacterium]|jgi:hypothetical protein|nr:hypothetical protein [Deltaproteobacteria bacterium]MCP4241022.1 hypothetical protein [bacterium]MDP6075809.1 hypothetical protein [Myxococcota bacterium]MDP7075554.1 hypothetical protein [Myxococcota bacterium]MDP7299717.1 hypothetical protein [Myxococcota bacterium]